MAHDKGEGGLHSVMMNALKSRQLTGANDDEEVEEEEDESSVNASYSRYISLTLLHHKRSQAHRWL